MSDSAHPTLATFRVHRDQDVSGISGTGVVAEGVQFSDGWVVTHWLDQAPMWEPKTDVWHHKGTQPITKVHGHGGATRIVWTRDEDQARHELAADVVEAFDVPGWVAGVEAERVSLRRQIVRALRQQLVHQRDPDKDERRGIDELADAVMPAVDQCLSQRNRWRTTVGRAFALAYRWQGAHGSSMFLVRAAGTELRDVLDERLAEGTELAAAECSAQHHGFPGDHRECIRAAQHRGDHIDEQGFHWSDTVAVYPLHDDPLGESSAVVHMTPPDGSGLMPCCGRTPFEAVGDRLTEWPDRVTCMGAPRRGAEPAPTHARASVSSCSHPDHACVKCGDCVYEHPGTASCIAPETSAQRDRAHNIGATEWHELAEDRAADSLEELVDAVRSVLGIDVRTVPTDLNTWLLTACRQLEKSEDAREHLRGQRNAVAQALREVIATFHEVKDSRSGEVLAHEAPHVVHPSNFNRWRQVLAGLPENCKKPGGCRDCPHGMGA